MKSITDVGMITSKSRVVMTKFANGGLETRHFKSEKALLRHLIVMTDDFDRLEEIVAEVRKNVEGLEEDNRAKSKREE